MILLRISLLHLWWLFADDDDDGDHDDDDGDDDDHDDGGWRWLDIWICPNFQPSGHPVFFWACLIKNIISMI